MWKQLSSKEIFRHPKVTLIEDEVELPSGFRTTYLYTKHVVDGTTVICRKPDRTILVQREYSYPVNDWLWQLPGGLLLPGEAVEMGANRELMEEANYRANRLTLLGDYYYDHRRQKGKMFVFLGESLESSSLPADPEEENAIESFWFSEEEIDEMIRAGKIENSRFLSAWCLYGKRKEL
ncbi:MAG: NUDIX hydrolase [Candidatus Moraniibacteriota bacterium]|nr:MAG: NUDIX hydrolase [Candidatus Moranbacteria bacterium]